MLQHVVQGHAAVFYLGRQSHITGDLAGDITVLDLGEGTCMATPHETVAPIITAHGEPRDFIRRELRLQTGYLTHHQLLQIVHIAHLDFNFIAHRHQVVIGPGDLEIDHIPVDHLQRQHARRFDIFLQAGTENILLGFGRQRTAVDFNQQIRDQQSGFFRTRHLEYFLSAGPPDPAPVCPTVDRALIHGGCQFD